MLKVFPNSSDTSIPKFKSWSAPPCFHVMMVLLLLSLQLKCCFGQQQKRQSDPEPSVMTPQCKNYCKENLKQNSMINSMRCADFQLECILVCQTDCKDFCTWEEAKDIDKSKIAYTIDCSKAGIKPLREGDHLSYNYDGAIVLFTFIGLFLIVILVGTAAWFFTCICVFEKVGGCNPQANQPHVLVLSAGTRKDGGHHHHPNPSHVESGEHHEYRKI